MASPQPSPSRHPSAAGKIEPPAGDLPVRRALRTVRFEPAGRSVLVPEGSSLLDAARRAGQPIARGCGAEGRCSRCGVSVLAGRVAAQDERESTVKQRNRIPAELRLACRVAIEDDLVVTAPYWG